LDAVLAEADAGDVLEAFEFEGGDGGDAGVGDDDFVGVEGFAVEEIYGEVEREKLVLY